MSTNDPVRRDARHCPRCGAMGILPLDQPAGDHGQIEDPAMICPVCNDEFRATGMRWLGTFDVAELTDNEVHEMAVALVDWQDRMSAQTCDKRVYAVSDDLIDPFGGPHERDPDLTIPREEDGVGD
jgi:hypothetical protein